MKTETVRATFSTGNSAAHRQPAVILYVDDDPNDVELLREATQRSGMPLVVHNAESGEEALEFLSRLDRSEKETPRFSSAPSLILLDLHLPRVNGVDVLQSIRSHPKTRATPVVVLSGSDYSRDRQRALDAGATSFYVKPASLCSLVELVKHIFCKWCI